MSISYIISNASVSSRIWFMASFCCIRALFVRWDYSCSARWQFLFRPYREALCNFCQIKENGANFIRNNLCDAEQLGRYAKWKCHIRECFQPYRCPFHAGMGSPQVSAGPYCPHPRPIQPLCWVYRMGPRYSLYLANTEVPIPGTHPVSRKRGRGAAQRYVKCRRPSRFGEQPGGFLCILDSGLTHPCGSHPWEAGQSGSLWHPFHKGQSFVSEKF